MQASEGVARDLREAIFLKIQSFSFGNLDRLKTVVTEKLDTASGRLRAAQDTSGFANVKAMQEERQLRASAALASFKAAKGLKPAATSAAPAKTETAKPTMAPSNSESA